MQTINFSKKGQTLLEVLVALGVAVLLIAGLSVLAVYALRNAQHGKNIETATRLAGEGIEQVRIVRDRSGWEDFVRYDLSKCYKVDTTTWVLEPLTSCNVEDGETPPAFEIFKRQIKLVDVDPGDEESRQVTVTVFWTDSQGPNQVSSDTILTQWK